MEHFFINLEGVPALEKKWYYLVDQERVGPVTWKELYLTVQAEKIKPNDLVWVEGLANWTPATEIKGLVSAPGGTADPASPVPAPAPPAAYGPAGSEQDQGFNINPFLKKISDTAKATASTISAKSAELAQSGKHRLEVNQLATQVKEKKTEIGNHVYQAFVDGTKPDEEALNSLNYEIKGYTDRIAELENQIAAEAQQAGSSGPAIPCPNCGNNLPQGAAFCGNCGQKYEPLLCANCGNQLAPGAKFCCSCGAPTGQ